MFSKNFKRLSILLKIINLTRIKKVIYYLIKGDLSFIKAQILILLNIQLANSNDQLTNQKTLNNDLFTIDSIKELAQNNKALISILIMFDNEQQIDYQQIEKILLIKVYEIDQIILLTKQPVVNNSILLNKKKILIVQANRIDSIIAYLKNSITSNFVILNHQISLSIELLKALIEPVINCDILITTPFSNLMTDYFDNSSWSTVVGSINNFQSSIFNISINQELAGYLCLGFNKKCLQADNLLVDDFLPINLVAYYIDYPDLIVKDIKRSQYLLSDKLINFVNLIYDHHLMSRSIKLIIDHNLGGGTGYYRFELIKDLLNQQISSCLVFYDLTTNHYIVTFVNQDTELKFATKFLDNILLLTECFKFKEIIYNNGVSFPEPLLLANFLLKLQHITQADLNINIHDHFIICPTYTLINNQGVFCQIPELSTCHKCLPKAEVFNKVYNQIDPIKWRTAWGQILMISNKIFCFSNYSANLMLKAYSHIEEKIIVKPHQPNYLPSRQPHIINNKRLNIGIVGHIAKHKGANIIIEMAKIITNNNLPIDITVIGTLGVKDSTNLIKVTGSYQREQLVELIEDLAINIFFLPSICPETFSYVTDELMNLGVAICCFDLGAPAERLKNYSKSMIITEVSAIAALTQIKNFYNLIFKDND